MMRFDNVSNMPSACSATELALPPDWLTTSTPASVQTSTSTGSKPDDDAPGTIDETAALVSERGGRGIAPSLGALLARAWPGAALVGAGMVAGKALRQTSAGTFVAEVALAPVLAVWGGRHAALLGAAVALPMLAKRMLGESRPERDRGRAYVHRLVFDHDRAGVTT